MIGLGASFNGNPACTPDFIIRTLQKDISDASRDPINTSFMLVFADRRSAPRYSLLDQF